MLDAGSVITKLGFALNPAAAKAYEDQVKKAVAASDAGEARMKAAAGRAAAAHDRLASSADKVRTSTSRMIERGALSSVDNLEKNSKKASQSLDTMGRAAAKTAAVGIGAVAVATIYAAKKATDFNREMLKIATQAGGSAKEVEKLKVQVLALAGQVPQGPQKLAEGLYHIQSAGFRGAQSMEMLKAAAEGAALGNASLENTTQAMIATTASQIKGVHGASDAMGQLNDIVGVGDMRMEQLAQAMATGLLPSAANAGLSLKDVGAALATVTDNATPANVTATRLRMTIALMASPSKAAAKQLESIGMSSTQMAHDMRQPNGLLKAVEDLKTHLRASGLTAEEQFGVLSKVFGGGRSSAVIQTLIAETDRLRTKYQQLGDSSGPQKLAKSWAEFQKSESAGFGELKSGAEAFAITVGNVLMPSLRKLATEGSHALQGFVASGGAEKLGHGIESVFSTLGSVVSNLAGPLKDAAGAMLTFGRAVGLTNPAVLSGLAAAFLTFKGLSLVAPILTAIGDAILFIGTSAATAGSVAAFGGDMVALAGGPVGAVVLALTAAAGAFVAIKSGLFDGSSAAERFAQAMNDARAAITGLNEASEGAAKAGIAHQRSLLDQKSAAEGVKKVEADISHGQLKGQAATDALAEARLRLTEATDRSRTSGEEATKAIEKEKTAQEKAIANVSATQKEKWERLNALEEEAHTLGSNKKLEEDRKRLHAEINQGYRETKQLQAEIDVSEQSRKRVEQGRTPITKQNAIGVTQLKNALDVSGAPKTIVTRYELDDQNAQAKLGTLAAKLESVGREHVVAQVLTTARTAAEGVAALTAVLRGVPAAKVIRILHNAHSVQEAISQLHGAINAVPGQKSVTVSTNAPAAVQGIEAIQSAIGALHGTQIAINILKTTTETVNRAMKVAGKAAGGVGSQQTALVGEGGAPEYVIDPVTGRAVKVSGPTLMGLNQTDYVVPTEDRYRGRAIGLFAMLAKDLGIPGYKTGKSGGGSKHLPVHPPKGHPSKPVPDHLDALSLPIEDIESRVNASKSAYDKAHNAVHSLTGRVTSAERNLRYASAGSAKHPSKTPAKDRAILAELKRQLDTAKAEEHKRNDDLKDGQRALRDAKAYQAKINHETQLANVAADQMRVADAHGDDAGYDAAKGRRQTALAALKSLVASARNHVKDGSEYFLKLSEQIGQTEVEESAVAGEEPPALTPDQVKQQKAIEAQVALAALTPGLADDKTAAQQLVSFFESALSTAQSRGAGSEAIAELASSVKSARSNLESLAGGSSTNENADLQAQIVQERERRETAERTAKTAEGALGVFAGAGDIGAGGANARAAVVVNVNTLHPGDPGTLHAIGAAATAGIGLQGSQHASRQRVGP